MLPGVPSAIVAASVSIEFCRCTGTFTIGYGQLMCWIGQPVASFFFFSLPILLALIVNFVLFTVILTSIQRAASAIKSSERHECHSKKQASRTTWLYARIISVMGFTWVFGFISSLMDVMTVPGLIFTYVYAILNAVDGLLICVAFTCNRRVAHLYRRLLAAESAVKRRAQAVISMTVTTSNNNNNNMMRRTKSNAEETFEVSTNVEPVVGQVSHQLTTSTTTTDAIYPM